MLDNHAQTQGHGPQAGMDHVLGYRNRGRDKSKLRSDNAMDNG